MLIDLHGFDWVQAFETVSLDKEKTYTIDKYVKDGGPPRGQAVFAFKKRCPVSRRERGEYVIHLPEGDVVVYSGGDEDD
jgi:hypothetical protein